MVKGVNKQVIEVLETGSKYFERALLIVNPKNSTDQSLIYHEAARMFSAPQNAKRRRFGAAVPAWLLPLSSALGALAGALTIWLLTL